MGQKGSKSGKKEPTNPLYDGRPSRYDENPLSADLTTSNVPPPPTLERPNVPKNPPPPANVSAARAKFIAQLHSDALLSGVASEYNEDNVKEPMVISALFDILFSIPGVQSDTLALFADAARAATTLLDTTAASLLFHYLVNKDERVVDFVMRLFAPNGLPFNFMAGKNANYRNLYRALAHATRFDSEKQLKNIMESDNRKKTNDERDFANRVQQMVSITLMQSYGIETCMPSCKAAIRLDDVDSLFGRMKKYFEMYYLDKNKGRLVVWRDDLSTLEIAFPQCSGTTTVTSIQAVVLEHLSREDASVGVTVADIVEAWAEEHKEQSVQPQVLLACVEELASGDLPILQPFGADNEPGAGAGMADTSAEPNRCVVFGEVYATRRTYIPALFYSSELWQKCVDSEGPEEHKIKVQAAIMRIAKRERRIARDKLAQLLKEAVPSVDISKLSKYLATLKDREYLEIVEGMIVYIP